MKTVCLILTLAGHLIPINKPFPSQDSCEIAGFGMTDGQTVKGYACLPRLMVDGLPIYDCGIVRDVDLIPPAATCTFTVMKPDGLMAAVAAPCDSAPPGAVTASPPDERPPIPKYQRRME